VVLPLWTEIVVTFPEFRRFREQIISNIKHLDEVQKELPTKR